MSVEILTLLLSTIPTPYGKRVGYNQPNTRGFLDVDNGADPEGNFTNPASCFFNRRSASSFLCW
jgi:hypothetical protein